MESQSSTSLYVHSGLHKVCNSLELGGPFKRSTKMQQQLALALCDGTENSIRLEGIVAAVETENNRWPTRNEQVHWIKDMINANTTLTLQSVASQPRGTMQQYVNF